MRDRQRLPNSLDLERRLSWGKFVDKAFWALLIFIGYSIASKVTRIDHNIESLNEKMAVAVEKDSSEHARMDAVQKRVDVLEQWRFAQRSQNE